MNMQAITEEYLRNIILPVTITLSARHIVFMSFSL